MRDRSNIKVSSLAVLVAIASATVNADAPNDANTTCAAEEAALKAIEAEFADDFSGLERDSRQLQKEGEQCDAFVELDCDMVRKDISFDTPSVKMTRQEWKLHAPKIYSKRKEIKFDFLKTWWEIETIGSYPKCHGLKCRKAYIRTKVPKSKWDTTRIVVDIPEVRWDVTSMKLDIPEFFMQRQKWSFDWPQCKVVGAGINTDCPEQMKKGGAALQARGEAIASRQQEAMLSSQLALTSCHKNDMIQKRAVVTATFEDAITQLESVIQQVRAGGGDPSKIAGEDGATIDLLAQLHELTQQRDSALVNFDEAVRGLEVEEDKFIVGGEKMKTPV